MHNKFNKFLFVKGVNIYRFEVKDSESNSFPLYLGNISKDFTVNNKETRLDVHVYDFSLNYDSIDVDDILDIYKFLMKKHNIK